MAKAKIRLKSIASIADCFKQFPSLVEDPDNAGKLVSIDKGLQQYADQYANSTVPGTSRLHTTKEAIQAAVREKVPQYIESLQKVLNGYQDALGQHIKSLEPPKVKTPRKKSERTAPRNLLGDIKKAGGVNYASLVNFIDRKLVNMKNGSWRGITKRDGIGLDQMAIDMKHLGWDVPVDHYGHVDTQAFADMVTDATNGNHPVHPVDAERVADARRIAEERRIIDSLTDEDIEWSSTLQHMDTYVFYDISTTKDMILADLFDEMHPEDYDRISVSIESVYKDVANILGGNYDTEAGKINQGITGEIPTGETGTGSETIDGNVANRSEESGKIISEKTDDAGGWKQQSAITGDSKNLVIGGVQKKGGRAVGLSEFMDGFTKDPQQDLFGGDSVTDEKWWGTLPRQDKLSILNAVGLNRSPGVAWGHIPKEFIPAILAERSQLDDRGTAGTERNGSEPRNSFFKKETDMRRTGISSISEDARRSAKELQSYYDRTGENYQVKLAEHTPEAETAINFFHNELGFSTPVSSIEKSHLFNATYYKGRIFLAQDNRNPVIALLAHEFTHSELSNDGTGNYAQDYLDLVDNLKPFMNKRQYENAKKAADTAYGRDVDQQQVMDEIVGDLFATRMNDRSFWKMMAEKFSGIATRWRDFLGKLLGEKSHLDNNHMWNDVKSAHDLADEFLSNKIAERIRNNGQYNTDTIGYDSPQHSAKPPEEGANAVTGDLQRVNPTVRGAVDEFLSRRPTPEQTRILSNLEKHKGTSWAASAVKGMAYREMLHRAMEGRSTSDLEVNQIWGKQDMGATKIVKALKLYPKLGDAVINKLIDQYDFIGSNRKAENDISGSFANCDPSQACAVHCYASNANSRPSEIAKSEFTEFALEKFPEIMASRISIDYNTTRASDAGLSLRLNDKGDLSEAQLTLIKNLNDKGIAVQVFSKRPDLLRKLSDINLKMLSVDGTNLDIAYQNPDLPLAVTITDDVTQDMISPLHDRVSVYLPVNLKGKGIGLEALKERFPELYPSMKNNNLCPVDGGSLVTLPGTSFVDIQDKIAPSGVWTCTTCDLYGGAGCFKGERSTNQRKAKMLQSDPGANRIEIDKTILTINRELSRLLELGGIDGKLYAKLREQISQGRTSIRSNAYAGAERTEVETASGIPGETSTSGEGTGRDDRSRIETTEQPSYSIKHQTLETFVDRKPAKLSEEYQDKSNYIFANNYLKQETISAALKFWDIFGSYGHNNPIIGKFGHSIYFSPDSRSIQRLGDFNNAFAEYALHSVTQKEHDFNTRTADLSKIRFISSLMDVIKNADGWYSRDGKINYVKMVKGKRGSAIILELNKDGGMESYRYVTQLPNHTIKNTLDVSPVASSISHTQNDGASSSGVDSNITLFDRSVNSNDEPLYSIATKDEIKALAWSAPQQKIGSASTSISYKGNLDESKTPIIFSAYKKGQIELGRVNADIGGGQYDQITNWLKDKGVRNIIWDRFNRSEGFNAHSQKILQGGKADTATLSNVLNVIAEPESRLGAIATAYDSIKDGGKLFISTYTAPKPGEVEGRDAYQLGMKTQEYVPEVEHIFGKGNVTRKGDIIIAVKNPDEPLYSLKPQPFSSKLEDVVEQKMGGKMFAPQLRSMLKNNGVSDDEISNVIGELDGTKSVTKADVQDAIKANSVQLKDVVLGGGTVKPTMEAKQLKDVDIWPGFAKDYPRHDWLVYRNGDPIYVSSASSAEGAIREYSPENDDDYDEETPTHFSQYTEPGAVPGSYREMFVTAPDAGGDIKELYEASSDGLTAHGRTRIEAIEEMQREYGKNATDVKRISKERWQDGHSEYSNIQNPVVRIRFNDREIPSTEGFTAFEDKYGWSVNDPSGKTISTEDSSSKTADEAIAKVAKQDAYKYGKRILFVEEMQGASDAYQQKMPDYLRKRIYDIGVKRVLAYAKEHGYDGVSWTTGDMQAQRYNLSKQISKITYQESEGKPGTFDISAEDNHGNSVMEEYGKTPSELGNIVGKEITHKIVNGEGKEIAGSPSWEADDGVTRSSKELFGLDLKVGGEGLKSLYDRTLPALFKKYGKEGVSEVGLGGYRINFNDGTLGQREFGDIATAQRVADANGGGTVSPWMNAPYIPITDKTPETYPLYSAKVTDKTADTESPESLDPTQIKSVDNRGTYDQNDPNIYYPTKETDQVPPEYASEYDSYLDKADAALASGDTSEANKWIDKAEEILLRPKPVREPEIAHEEPRGDGTTDSPSRRTTGIKNAVTEEEQGEQDKWTFTREGIIDAGKAKVDHDHGFDPRELAKRIIANPHMVVTPEEQAALLYDRMRLYNEHDSMSKNIVKARETNDSQAILDLTAQRSRIEDNLADNAQAVTYLGTSWSAFGHVRQQLLAQDYSLAYTLQRVRAASGKRDIPEAVRKKMEGLIADIEAAQKAIAERDSLVKTLKDDLQAALARENVRIKPTRADKRQSESRKADAEVKTINDALRRILNRTSMNPMFDPETVTLLGQLMLKKVVGGIKKATEIVDSIHSDLATEGIHFDKRDIRDALSQYGVTSELSQEEIKVELRELKRQMRGISGLEDAQNGIPPSKSGMQRDPKSDEMRDIERMIHDAMRESGIDSKSSGEDSWKSSMDGIKTRLKNEIRDLDVQIANREKTHVDRPGIPYDEEAKALKDQRDAKRDILQEIEHIKAEMAKEPVPDDDPYETAMEKFMAKTQRLIESRQKSLDKSIEENRRRISEGDLKPSQHTSTTPSTPEIDAKQELLDGLKDTLKKMREAAKPPVDLILKAQEAMKTRLRNEIVSLDKQILAGKRKNDTRTPVEIDAEIAHLKEIKAGKRALLNQIDARPAKTVEELRAIALKAYKTRTASRIVELNRKLATGDYSTKIKNVLKLDPESEHLRDEAAKLKDKVDAEIRRIEMENRGLLEKSLDRLGKWQRFVILSGTRTIAKLGAAATARSGSTPIEELVGMLINKLPGLRGIAEDAPRYGSGWNNNAEAAALAEWFTRHTWEDTLDVVKTGRGELSRKYDKKVSHSDSMTEMGWTEIVGHIHGAMKNPVKRAEFQRSYQIIADWYQRKGYDIYDENIQKAIGCAAYAESLRAIFMQDNLAVTKWRMFVNHGKNNHAMSLMFSAGMNSMQPIVKIPTNFLAEHTVTALGLPVGIGEAIVSMLRKRRGEPVDLQFNDDLLRHLRKGLIGALLMLIGYLNPDTFGGYYEPGDKRKEGDLKAGQIKNPFKHQLSHLPGYAGKILGQDISPLLTHHPYFAVLQLGATIRRSMDAYHRYNSDPKHAGEEKKHIFAKSVAKGVAGAVAEAPYMGTAKTLSDTIKYPENVGTTMANHVVNNYVLPFGARSVARNMDSAGDEVIPRKQETLAQIVLGNVPGMRSSLPVDVKKFQHMPYERAKEIYENAPQAVKERLRDVYERKQTAHDRLPASQR